MTRGRLMITISVAAIGGVALYAQQRQQQAEVGELRAQIEALGQAVKQAQAAPGRAVLAEALALSRVASAPQVPPSPVPQTAAPARTAPSSATLEPPEPPGQRAAQLERSFEGQREDPAWASAARQQLTRALATRLPPQSSLRTIDCRGTLCRLEVLHGSTEDHEAFLQRGLQGGGEPPWRGAMYLPAPQELPDGKLLAVLYLGREGQPLVPDTTP